MPRIPRRWKGAAEQPPPPEPSAPDAAPDAAPADPAPQHPTAPEPTASEQPTSALEAAAAPESATVVAPDGATAAPESATVVAPDGTAAAPESATVVAPDGATVVTPAGGEAAPVAEHAPPDASPRFRARSRMRRRLRYLRRRRELAFRDLGGLVFDLHRFGRDRGDLVASKLQALGAIDGELRTLQDALRDRREVTDLREPGIAACPRCQTLHDTDANFCPGCGTSLRGAVVRDVAPVIATPADEQPQQQQQQPTPTPS